MKKRTDRTAMLRLGRMAADIESLAVIGLRHPEQARETCENICRLYEHGYRMLPLPFGDPIRIVAKKSGHCSLCRRAYRAGAELLWRPGSPVVQHLDCSRG